MVKMIKPFKQTNPNLNLQEKKPRYISYINVHNIYVSTYIKLKVFEPMHLTWVAGSAFFSLIWTRKCRSWSKNQKPLRPDPDL